MHQALILGPIQTLVMGHMGSPDSLSDVTWGGNYPRPGSAKPGNLPGRIGTVWARAPVLPTACYMTPVSLPLLWASVSSPGITDPVLSPQDSNGRPLPFWSLFPLQSGTDSSSGWQRSELQETDIRGRLMGHSEPVIVSHLLPQ
jgi:hypothetical protein